MTRPKVAPDVEPLPDRVRPRPVSAIPRGLLSEVFRAQMDAVAREIRWQSDALCVQVDPEVFFPPKGSSPAAAKMICRRCPVTATCLEWAIANNDDSGILGGMSYRERRQERARRAAAEVTEEATGT